jgi:hypothetical protein
LQPNGPASARDFSLLIKHDALYLSFMADKIKRHNIVTQQTPGLAPGSTDASGFLI